MGPLPLDLAPGSMEPQAPASGVELIRIRVPTSLFWAACVLTGPWIHCLDSFDHVDKSAGFQCLINFTGNSTSCQHISRNSIPDSINFSAQQEEAWHKRSCRNWNSTRPPGRPHCWAPELGQHPKECHWRVLPSTMASCCSAHMAAVCAGLGRSGRCLEKRRKG